MRVVVFDVGQGDATLIQTPDRRAWLVDAGGLAAAPLRDPADGPAFDIGDRVVVPAARALGIRRLDGFVITHADADHIGGAPAIVRSFRPRLIWEGIPVPREAALGALSAAADRHGAAWQRVQSHDYLRLGEAEIRVLHPPPPEWERQRVRNDDSVVLSVALGGVQIVLPGDVTAAGERTLLGEMPSGAPVALPVLPVVILKVAHHGSATSTTPELVDRLRPEVAIVSAGRANRFGHPAPAVVRRLTAARARLFSTAEHGAIVVDTNGVDVRVWTWTVRELLLRVGRR